MLMKAVGSRVLISLREDRCNVCCPLRFRTNNGRASRLQAGDRSGFSVKAFDLNTDLPAYLGEQASGSPSIWTIYSSTQSTDELLRCSLIIQQRLKLRFEIPVLYCSLSHGDSQAITPFPITVTLRQLNAIEKYTHPISFLLNSAIYEQDIKKK